MYKSSQRRPRPAFVCAVALLFLLTSSIAVAQTDEFGDNSVDPIKMFERGQNAHARGDLNAALAFYEQAIKLRPEFPEAEFQRGTVLVTLSRASEAETAFRRAMELRKNWSLPYSSLGLLLMRTKRDKEAEPLLRQAIALDAQNSVALRALADIRLRAGDAQDALELAKRATNDKDAPASSWALLAVTQRAVGDKTSARTSLDHALELEPDNIATLEERADLEAAEGDYEHAIADLKKAETLKTGDKQILSRLLDVYSRAGKTDDANRLAQALGINNKPPTSSDQGTIRVVGTPEEIEAANSPDLAKARIALETLLTKNPRNAMLLARLGASYRTDDPTRALDFYRRANLIEPGNSDYAAGYGAALVQARRFSEAAVILRRVIAAAPENHVAHANLATALYELKSFAEALPQYEWLLKAEPDLIISYYFIAISHDKLGEYEDALAAYQTFLARANAQTNELEIEKVKLRLPSLKRQISLKQGTKRRP